MTGNDEEAHYWDLSKCRQVCVRMCVRVCVQPLGCNVVKNISDERASTTSGCVREGALPRAERSTELM